MRTSSAPSSSRSRWRIHEGARRDLLPGVADRRTRRPLGARAHLRGARQVAVRGALRPDEHRPAAQQPRRPRDPSRQASRSGWRPLQEAFAWRSSTASDDDVATVVSSLAQVYLKTGDPVRAEEHARHALRRSAAARIASMRSGTHGSCSAARCSSRSGSMRPGSRPERRRRTRSASSRPARIGLRRGSPKATSRAARGDDRRAAALYRHAAEALQDFRF